MGIKYFFRINAKDCGIGFEIVLFVIQPFDEKKIGELLSYLSQLMRNQYQNCLKGGNFYCVSDVKWQKKSAYISKILN